MLPRRGQALFRAMGRPSFAGRGLLERARSTTFAILGITTAMGLGLVAFVSQQGLSSLPSLPLPGLSAEPGKVDEAEVVAGPAIPIASSPQVGGGRDLGVTADRGEAPRDPSSFGVAGSDQLAVAPTPPRHDPAPDNPPTQEAPPAPVPPPLPADTPPAAPSPTPQPAAATPPTTVSPPGKSAAAVGAPADDERKSGEDGESSDEDKAPGGGGADDEGGQPRGNAYGKYKPSGGRRGGKPGRTEPPPPVTTTPPSDEVDTPVPDESSDEAESEPPEQAPDDYRPKGGRGYGHFGK